MNTLKIFSTAIFIAMSFFCYSQDSLSDSSGEMIKSISERKNEIKLGVVKILAIPVIDIQYERIINRNSSFGSNLRINLGDEYQNYDFSFSPFFKMYFSKSEEYGIKGFFAQGFVNYFAGESFGYTSYNNGYYIESRNNYNALAVGFGLGQKWVNSSGFIFQLSGGVGRSIIKNNNAPDFILQGDIFIGYRF